MLVSLAASEKGGLRHIVRRLTESLEGIGLRTLDLEGLPYDSGMVVDVIEVREDPTASEGSTIIDETISPTVMWNGQVVRPGQVVVRRSTAKPVEPLEGVR
jgi:hypothetical protein